MKEGAACVPVCPVHAHSLGTQIGAFNEQLGQQRHLII